MTREIRLALFAVSIFSLAGIVGWFTFVTDARESLPLAIIYGLLVINAFPSIKLFASIARREDGRNALADVLIFASYIFVAASLGQPAQFALCATVLFLVAAGKYALLLHDIPHPDLLQRKLRVDLIGAFICASALAVMLFGYVSESSWALATIFILANIYVLGIRPLYRV
jgi:hypothetical protein